MSVWYSNTRSRALEAVALPLHHQSVAGSTDPGFYNMHVYSDRGGAESPYPALKGW